MKLYVIFNTCGIGGRENVQGYINSIENILNQNFSDFRVGLSSCLNSPMTTKKLIEYFGDRISYNFIHELHPVNVTFNHTALKMWEQFGEADGIMFLDSGIDFGPNPDVLKNMFELFKSGPYGMVAARTDTDTGTFLWFGEGSSYGDESGQAKLFENGHLEFPIGKTTNLHCQIFSKEVFLGMGKRLMPDIFASHCTESTFSFVTAAVNQKFVMHKDVVVSHVVGMDGPSAGFRPEKEGVIPWRHLYRSPKTIEQIIEDPEAKESGFGYEECQDILLHNPNCYENGFCKEPERLKKFITANIYLPKEALDYEAIANKFIP